MILKEFFPKDKIIWEITKTILFTSASGLSYFVFPDLPDKLSLYDTTFLICSALLFICIVIVDIFLKIKLNFSNFNFIIISNIVIVILFVTMTNWSSDNIINNHIPIVFALIVLFIVKISQLIFLIGEYVNKSQIRKDVGFATTGVLISISNIDEPTMFLVLNKNLRGGNGLWVPPGGHFSPQIEKAEDKIKSKILHEIGVNCEIFNPFEENLPSRIEDANTTEVKWLIPPVFFLEENLMGKCSQEHETHIDLVYLCLTKGIVVNSKHKYDLNNRIEIPLKNCIESIDNTERLVFNTIDQWHQRSSGSKPCTRQDITKDVIWRLHLTAKIFDKYYKKLI